MKNWLKNNALYVALLQALAATLGSLYFSEILHLAPCTLCWYQRIAMYPLVIVIAAGLIKKIKNLEYIILPLVIIGLIISFYHNLLQYGIISQAQTTCSVFAPCVTHYFLIFNFITIPLLSFIAFLIIGACAIISGKK